MGTVTKVISPLMTSVLPPKHVAFHLLVPFLQALHLLLYQPPWLREPSQQDLPVTLMPMSAAGNRTEQTILIGRDIVVVQLLVELVHQ